MNEVRLSLQGVTRYFDQPGGALKVLQGIDLTVSAGQMVALVGPSGAGKSTLLQIAGLLEPPTGGEITIGGRAADQLSDKERTRMRRDAIGFVYQFHHLLPEFSAEENIALPQIIAGKSKREARARAAELLAAVGLSQRAGHRPAKLSGGEQQRVAIARALANRPILLLADEPTGNLDHTTADSVFAMLAELIHTTGTAALVATHNLELAERMDRTVELRDGFLHEQPREPSRQALSS
ncbi:MAG: ABC transporter ATP-binding protein [Pseudomonadota bacterium]